MHQSTGLDRTFSTYICEDVERFSRIYLIWFRQFLYRLGEAQTRTVWDVAFTQYNDTWIREILAGGWQQHDDCEIPSGITPAAVECFSIPVEGIGPDEARTWLEKTPPFRQIIESFPDLHFSRQITTYEALHLFFDGLALLAEAMIDLHGKQGELIVYDAILDEVALAGYPKIDAEAYLRSRAKRFSQPPEEPDIFSAGLEVVLVKHTPHEVINHVTHCEWARYYHDHHPRVGYLLACSPDNGAYCQFNPNIRLQRTSTIMEGGDYCDFRVYDIRGD